MKLSAVERDVLLALARGCTLKSHRFLDGNKLYRLHPLDGGEPEPVAWETMDRLRDAGLIDSNKKFPAATYLLTDRGRQAVDDIAPQDDDPPLSATGWQ